LKGDPPLGTLGLEMLTDPMRIILPKKARKGEGQYSTRDL
jgi:hypothetical protein